MKVREFIKKVSIQKFNRYGDGKFSFVVLRKYRYPRC